MSGKRPATLAILFVVLLWASLCCASGGRVTYANGQPVAGAEVRVHLQEVDKYKLLTDQNGRFTLPTIDFLDAFVQIQAPNGKDFATVNLPVRMFDTGEIAVVLQQK